jgi:hypothetical protein
MTYDLRPVREALRRKDEAELSYRITFWLAVVAILAEILDVSAFFEIAFWGYDGKFVHEDRGGLTALVCFITMVAAPLGIYVICLRLEEIPPAWKRRRQARYDYEDALDESTQ